jgi:hypothetical protein
VVEESFENVTVSNLSVMSLTLERGSLEDTVKWRILSVITSIDEVEEGYGCAVGEMWGARPF